MSEPKYNYLDGQIFCTVCGLLIGEYVTVEKQTWLRVGTLEVFAAHGNCANCASEYHFSASEKSLERILSRRKQRKNVV